MATEDAAGFGSGQGGFNPIDHIFQFHKALRQELGQLEEDAVSLELVVLAAEALQQQLAQPQQQQGQEQQQQQDGAAAAAAAAAAGGGGGGSGTADAAAGSSGQVQVAAAAAAGQAKQQHSTVQLAGALRGVSQAVQRLSGRFHFLWGIYR
jgi:hypothetical protein